MTNYTFNATRRIAEEFDRAGISYYVPKGGKIVSFMEEVRADIDINGGPRMTVRFISTDNDNDVAVRVAGLVCRVPVERRERIIDACGLIENKVRYFKVTPPGENGNIDLEYDFPQMVSDECVGRIAVEIFLRAKKLLDGEYHILMKALYTNDPIKTMDSFQEEAWPDGQSQETEDARDEAKNDETADGENGNPPFGARKEGAFGASLLGQKHSQVAEDTEASACFSNPKSASPEEVNTWAKSLAAQCENDPNATDDPDNSTL